MVYSSYYGKATEVAMEMSSDVATGAQGKLLGHSDLWRARLRRRRAEERDDRGMGIYVQTGWGTPRQDGGHSKDTGRVTTL